MEKKVTKVDKIEFSHNDINCRLEINSETKKLISASAGSDHFFGEDGLEKMDAVVQLLTTFKENI